MKKHQSGSVLAIGLVLLTAITLIAMMGLQRSGLQTKIVGNLQHKEGAIRLAKSIAEAALREMDNREDENDYLRTIERQYHTNKNDASKKAGVAYPTNRENDPIRGTVNIQYLPGTPRSSQLTDALQQGASLSKVISPPPRFEIIANAQTITGIQSTQVFGIEAVPK